MKWLFGMILMVFLVFGGLMVAGYLSPETVSIERAIRIDAEPDDVFPYLNDLSKYEEWSPLHAQIPDAEIFYGGAPNGVGQTSVWKSEAGSHAYGTQEIVASEPPEFVQLAVNLAGREASSFYGISRTEDDEAVMVLMDTSYSLGGFPYIQRLGAQRQIPLAEAEFDAALNRLKTIVELNVEDAARHSAE